jgi:hypothetical protein
MADTVEGSVPTDTTAASPAVTAAATSDLMSALNQQADQARRYYEKLAKQIKQVATNATNGTTSTGDTTMAEIMTPGMIMGGGSGGDGLFGGAGAGGLVGGLILGSLLRQGRGGLFGDDGGAAVGGAVLRNPPEQNQANMDLMAGIGAVDKAVAIAQAANENSNAMQTNMLSGQLSQVAQATVAQLTGVKEAVMNTAAQTNQNIMENRYVLAQNISNDGDKTRALITQQYEMNLQRQLADANAAIIELRNDRRIADATAGVTVTTTNNINQMQQQQQQQAQFAQLGNLIWTLGQSIRSNNEAINVGSGTLTANPTNTNTNIR